MIAKANVALHCSALGRPGRGRAAQRVFTVVARTPRWLGAAGLGMVRFMINKVEWWLIRLRAVPVRARAGG